MLDAIRFDKDVTGLDPKDALVIEFTRRFVLTNGVRSDVFAKAVETFGRRGVVEMAELVGDYLMVRTMYNALDMRFPPNLEPTLPYRVGAPSGVAP